MTSRHLFNFAGGVTTLIALYYVFATIPAGEAISQIAHFVSGHGLLVLLVFFTYLLSLLLQSLAWVEVLSGAVALNRIQALLFYGYSQLYRYIPGNISHYAARQLFAKSRNLAQRTAALASLAETSTHVVSSALFALLVLVVPGIWESIISRDMNTQLTVVALVVSAILVIIVALAIRSARENPATLQRLAAHRKSLLACLVYNLLYFLINSLIFCFLIIWLHETRLAWRQSLAIIGIYNLAWLGGFLTPAAPAGVGVRETILLVMGAVVLPGQSLDLAIVSLRLLQVAGDVLYATISFGLYSTRVAP